jgi:hypothetical protein
MRAFRRSGNVAAAEAVRAMNAKTTGTKNGAVRREKVPTPDGERNRGDPDFPAGVGDAYRDTSQFDATGHCWLACGQCLVLASTIKGLD